MTWFFAGRGSDGQNCDVMGNNDDSNLAKYAGDEAILLLEDEQVVRVVTARVLERSGYRVHAAATVAEGRSLWTLHGASVRLLLCDVGVLGEFGGGELVAAIQRGNPAVAVLFTSGLNHELATERHGLPGTAAFLPKPYTAMDLLVAVRAILDGGSQVPDF